MDNKIILYFGTGDVTRLELNDSITENKIFAVKDKELIDFNSNSTPLKEKDLIKIDNTKVCEETEKGWIYPLEKNVKITGKAAIKKNLIYFSSYLPNYDDLCMPGNGNLLEFNYSCGSLLKTVELKEGAPTGATIYKNNIYIGISGIPNSKEIQLTNGFTRKNNLIVGTIANINNQSTGTILVESWRQLN